MSLVPPWPAISLPLSLPHIHTLSLTISLISQPLFNSLSLSQALTLFSQYNGLNAESRLGQEIRDFS